MGWQETKETCPHCGKPLYVDTSTGELTCLNPNCDEDED